MPGNPQPLFSEPFLRSVWDEDYVSFRESDLEKQLIERLRDWAGKSFQKETSAEGTFVDLFFKQTWGYTASGEAAKEQAYSCWPQFPVEGAGETGGTGEADLGLGWFDHPDLPPTPQGLCEFKDIRSSLDARQNRKGNTRSPVKQCADYLRESAKELYGNEAIQPTWGIVTDMNEFRLYWRNTMPAQYQRFVIQPATMDEAVSLLGDNDQASFERFLFQKLFHAEQLLTPGGPSPLLRLLQQQWVRERDIENEFYKEYRTYRERLYNAIKDANPDFAGTKGRLVRLAQKLIDRCIFVLFCEDMGQALSFPPNALRDYLAEYSKASYYDEGGEEVWNMLRKLFEAMDRGEKFLSHSINRFNGGLFAADPELEGLSIPNHVFCERMQGENEETLRACTQTLLYLSATYNFGASNGEGHAITLYTLGRIFEQSITELEVLEAEAEGRLSLTMETKRKREGVYYTPEWVVQHIVEETVGKRLQEIRDEIGWSIEIEGDDELAREQREREPSKRSKAFQRHVDAVQAYKDRLDRFTVLDPACGSGAFLIHALEYLLRERQRVSAEIARVTRAGEGLFEFNTETEIRTILSRNIFGVDINPASVEITSLALWLHTAKPDQALCDLDDNIKDGNSLIGPAFYAANEQFKLWPEEKREQVNVFDWRMAFPGVFDDGNQDGPGFDCVVGNPPYVKFQNFRKVYAEMAKYLKDGIAPNGEPLYASTQKGNFDLFLPFIEKAIQLLNDKGRMGFIAPSLWRFNEYGEGLRRMLYDGHHLDRWIDFGSFQVFEEAITYTALQFYSKAPCDIVRFVFARDGSLVDAPDWDDPNWCMNYDELPDNGDPWVFVPHDERALIERLNRDCERLDDPSVTSAIFQGLITSADYIFHLRKVGAGRYLHKPKGEDPYEVEIEEAIMRPLVSGEEAKRFTSPVTDTHILFPYDLSGDRPCLFTERQMEQQFPQAWSYLQGYEKALRGRESNAFDDESWYRFGRHQNIDKQECRKLIVAQTVPNMRVCADNEGLFCLNNVRVNGILPAEDADFWYLLGVLNSAAADWVFRRIAKPKAGGFFEANRQFIAPLPVPDALPEQKEQVTEFAQCMQELHTRKRDSLLALEKRLETCTEEHHKEEWLWPEVRSLAHWKDQAPDELSAREKSQWAKERRNVLIEGCLQAIQVRLHPEAQLEPSFCDGELSFSIDGVPVIEGVFVDDDQGKQILISWRHIGRATSITEKFTAKKLADMLREPRLTDNPALADQLRKLDGEISQLEAEIADCEKEMDELVFDLYELSEEERRLVGA